MSRSDLPSGTVTFLFTDVEGSTRLLREHGAAYADLLAAHRAALRRAFSAHGGVEVDTQGDAFFVAFGSTTFTVDVTFASLRNVVVEFSSTPKVAKDLNDKLRDAEKATTAAKRATKLDEFEKKVEKEIGAG